MNIGKQLVKHHFGGKGSDASWPPLEHARNFDHIPYGIQHTCFSYKIKFQEYVVDIVIGKLPDEFAQGGIYLHYYLHNFVSGVGWDINVVKLGFDRDKLEFFHRVSDLKNDNMIDMMEIIIVENLKR